MKTKIVLSLALLAMLLACSNNDNEKNDHEIGKVDITQNIEFKVNLTNFNAEKEVNGTRAMQASDIISRKTVDLGNNLLAEVIVQRDTTKVCHPAVVTRSLDNDSYTMLVFQGTSPTYTFKGQVTGTLKDGKFQPNKGLRLLPGKYIFVLHNSRMSLVTTHQGTPELKFTRDNADKALLGQTEYTVTATPDPQYVDFQISHVGSRMRIKLSSWVPILANTTASIQDFNYSVLPKDCMLKLPYNGDMNVDGNLKDIDFPLTFPASSTTPDATGIYTTTSNEYIYFVPGTRAEGLKLKFTGGQIYKMNMNGVSVQLISLVDAATQQAMAMASNESYLVNIKLRYNFLYLMSDGSTDFINSTQYTALRADDGKTPRYMDKRGNVLNTPKVPIAVVVSQSRGMAVALKDAGGGAKYPWIGKMSLQSKAVNKSYVIAPEIFHLLALENGYSETWDASASTDNTTVKGSSNDFPAFKAAGDYQPGVSVTGTMVGRKWYLPAFGEWKYVFSALGFGDVTKVKRYDLYPWNVALADIAFTQVGGTALYRNYDNYVSSSEYQIYSWEHGPQHVGVIWNHSYSGFLWTGMEKRFAGRVRPFIKYK